MREDRKRQESKEIIQSRSWTLLSRNTTGPEENILLMIVKKAQEQIKGMRSDELNCRRNLWNDVEFDIYLNDLSDKNNYYNYRAAFKSLLKKTFDFGNDDSFELIPFLLLAKAEPRSNRVTVRVAEKVWDLLLDFSKQFSIYRPDIVLRLPTAISKRIYQLICSNKKTIYYSVETLNEMFQTHYGPSMLERRILVPAKKNLDRFADVSFTYEAKFIKRSPKSGRKSLGGWNITVHKIANAKAEEAEVDYLVHHGAVKRAPKKMREWLIAEMGYTAAGLDNIDKELAQYAEQLDDDWRLCFETIKTKISRVAKQKTINNVQGYFFRSIANWITLNKPASVSNDSVALETRYDKLEPPEMPIVSEPETVKPKINVVQAPSQGHTEAQDVFMQLQNEILKNLKD